jgi:hypothetical protein
MVCKVKRENEQYKWNSNKSVQVWMAFWWASCSSGLSRHWKTNSKMPATCSELTKPTLWAYVNTYVLHPQEQFLAAFLLYLIYWHIKKIHLMNSSDGKSWSRIASPWQYLAFITDTCISNLALKSWSPCSYGRVIGIGIENGIRSGTK